MGERTMTQMATQANESGLFLSVLSGAHAGAAARVASATLHYIRISRTTG